MRVDWISLWASVHSVTLSGCVLLGLVGYSTLSADEYGPTEPLGPSSRRTPLVISEIMYAPAPRNDGRDLEFIELYNSQPWSHDLSGYRLAGDIHFTFPPNTILSSNAFLVVARSVVDLQFVYPNIQVVGGYSGSLPHSSGSIRLEHPNGGVLLEVNYSRKAPWPVAAAEAGHSLVLARSSLGERDVHAWLASMWIGGSPGTLEPDRTEPLKSSRINEFLANSVPPMADFVELYNSSSETLDLSGCILSDDLSLNKCVLPIGTTLKPGTFFVLGPAQLGFKLKASGEALYLWNASRTAILDATQYGPQEAGFSSGRFPNGGAGFRPLAKPTPGQSNDSPLVHDIVINEIMYDPISRDTNDEYLELYNRGTQALNLSGWQFVDGLSFVFPVGTVMAPDSYLVVAKNAAQLRSRYPNLDSRNTVGDYVGSLANSGERITLTRADGVMVDQVTYGVGGRWGQWSHGGGSSLERIDPRGNPNQADNWADSDETAKAPWTTVEFTGKLNSYGLSSLGLRSLYLVLMGAGECLIDNVEVFKEGGSNLVANPTFQTGLSNWFGQGNHERVLLEPAGFDDTASLRLSATDAGDATINRLGARLNSGLLLTDSVTLRARVRWLHGCPEILLRLIDNQLEAYGSLRLPANLGTPGMRNSRAILNAGPAFSNVRHLPVLPAPQQPIVVTAQVEDADGLSEVLVYYRIDPSTNLVSLPMNDQGREGDAVAGDGIYSTTIPGQPSGTLIAFHSSASDQTPQPAKSYFPADPPNRECLVRVGELTPSGPFGIYRLWMTQTNIQRWKRRDPFSDEPLDATFVYGGNRVIYNVGAYYAGRGAKIYYVGPTNTSCDYRLIFPETDRFLGATDMQLSWPGMGGRLPDATLQTEQAAYWLAEQAGLPTCHRRFVYLFFNGIRRGELVEDSQKPNDDYVAEWFPEDTDGELYALHNPLDFGDGGYSTSDGISGRALSIINVLTNTPPERAYRWVWNKRAAHGTKNDLRNVYELIDAFNATDTQTFTDGIEALVDVEQWMRTFAVERAVGNWDSFGFVNDQNMYFYKPLSGKWRLCIWDMDMMLGLRVGAPEAGVAVQVWACPANHDLFSHFVNVYVFSGLTVSPPETRFLKHPPFARIYLRSLQALIDGPMPRINELLDTKQAIFAANGFITESKDSKLADAKNYVTQRIKSIRKQLLAFQPAFGISTPDNTIITNTEPIAILTGTASFEVESIKVNGIASQVTWGTITNWSAAVPLMEGSNRFAITGHGAGGSVISGALGSVTLVYFSNAPSVPLALFIDKGLNDALVFSWSAVPGKKYRLEYKLDLNQTSWIAAGEIVPVTSLARMTNHFGFESQRFYRLVEQ